MTNLIVYVWDNCELINRIRRVRLQQRDVDMSLLHDIAPSHRVTNMNQTFEKN